MSEQADTNTETSQKMTRREENFHMMMTLRMTWSEANGIDDEEDRKFLMDRVGEMHSNMAAQRQMAASAAAVVEAPNQDQ
tara:strand:- start:438 stop:677 length:240 start_codon:yes stop_codon:yes gene_type:complete